MSTLEERNLAIIETIMLDLGVSDIEELPAKVHELKEAAEQAGAGDLGKAQEGRDTGEGFGPLGNRPSA